MKEKIVKNKNRLGSWILLIGIFIILMLNLNQYEVYQGLMKLSYVLTAVLLIAVFLCVVDWKETIKDKAFYLLVTINVLGLIFMMASKTGMLAYIPLFSLSIGLYTSDKIRFSKLQWVVVTVLCAAFFVYWTIDVKGYYKGYSINFGGLVLLLGFVFLILGFEYIKWIELCKQHAKRLFLKKYPYYLIFIEILLFIWAYKIMSWYRSRTAVAALIVFAILMCVPHTIVDKKWFRILSIGVTGIGAITFPWFYIIVCNKGILEGKEVFYKPLAGSRVEIWSFLISLIKAKTFTGNGTIVVGAGTAFREGLLDTCNSVIQLLTVHGVIVAALTIALLLVVVLRILDNASGSMLLKPTIAGVIAIMASSYSENSLLTVPFTMMFIAFLSVGNNVRSLTEDVLEQDQLATLKEVYKASEMCTKPYREKFVPVCLVTGMLMIMYLILGPLEIFYSNYSEFEFNTIDFIPFFVIVSVIITVLLALVLASLPRIVSVIYSIFAFSFGTGSYIQYMFINGDLVDREGNYALDLSIGSRYAISVFIFIAVLVIVTFVYIRFLQIRKYLISYGSIFLILVMNVAIVTIGVNLLLLENKPRDVIAVDATSEFDFAKDENTIVVILDTFGRSVLKEELAEDENAIDFLHDFTFYKNHDSVYCPTFPSLYHMLTEYEYTDDQGDDYSRNSFSSDSAHAFFDTLHESGYYVGMYSIDIKARDYMDGYFDNFVPCTLTINRRVICEKLLKMSIYRYLPYNLKKSFQVYNPRENMTSYSIVSPGFHNNTFYERMNEWGITVNDSIDKKFTLSHLYGIHSPIANDEDCARVPDNSVSRHQRTKGVLKAVRDYLDKLKEAGIYDNATIIVTADHGEYGATDSIFFEKKPGEEHDAYIVDDSEITHHEFQRIIMDSLR